MTKKCPHYGEKDCYQIQMYVLYSQEYVTRWTEDVYVCVCRDIDEYLNQPHVQEALGIDPSSLRGNFSLTNWDVNFAFADHADMFVPTEGYVAELLERNVPVLIYVGANDWTCNKIGVEKWTVEMDWSRKEEFVGQELRPWHVDGKPVGMTRSTGPFTYLTIDGGGHMVRHTRM